MPKLNYIFLVIILLCAKDGWAGGAVAARRRATSAPPEALQRQIEAQARERAQSIAQQQEQVILRQRAIAQAQAAAITQQTAQQVLHEQRIRQINVHYQEGQEVNLGLSVPVSERPKGYATLDEVVNSLRESSQDWLLIMDEEAKASIVAQYIQEFQKQGIVINGSPSMYAQMIDGMSLDAPQMLEQPFSQILQVVSILQYDFNNGQDKDTLALKVLGNQDAVIKNRARLGF